MDEGTEKDQDLRLDWLQKMVTIRLFEERTQELWMQGLMAGSTHLAQGQEAVSVGVISAMEPQDYLTVTYRGHGQALARGVSIEAAFAELMGRSAGLCRGIGGSMHFTDFNRNLIGAFAIVGAGLPVAVGAGMSAKLRGVPAVSVTFFGDGAANIGTFHESLNMASVWKAPVVFICENNLYGEYSAMHKTTAIENIADRAAGYSMPGRIVDGMDVAEVYKHAGEAIERARSGEGPTLLEAKTYRYRGHSRSDPAKYRPAGELDAWKAKDPIERLRRELIDGGVITEQEYAALESETQQRIDGAADRAATSPSLQLDDLPQYVYSQEMQHVLG